MHFVSLVVGLILGFYAGLYYGIASDWALERKKQWEEDAYKRGRLDGWLSRHAGCELERRHFTYTDETLERLNQEMETSFQADQANKIDAS